MGQFEITDSGWVDAWFSSFFEKPFRLILTFVEPVADTHFSAPGWRRYAPHAGPNGLAPDAFSISAARS